jgi:hypothetical protein
MIDLQGIENWLACTEQSRPRLGRGVKLAWLKTLSRILDQSNVPRQPRRDSGVGLDAVVGLLPVGLIPIPPMILQEANRRAMENGDLTFGHGFALGLALCAAWGLCAAAIWIKRAIVRRFRKANKGLNGNRISSREAGYTEAANTV